MHPRPIYSEGKTTYYINGMKFYNSGKGSRDGYSNAVNYCLENFLSTNDIIKFDSDLECNRYLYLKELEKQGKIIGLNHHTKIKVLDAFVNANGDTIPEVIYNADFVYRENGLLVVEDVKGASLFQDTRFELMKQVFDRVFLNKNTYIKIVVYRDKKWVEWKFGDKKKPQKLIKKQQESIRTLKKELHDKEIKERKIERLKARYKVLANKEKLTKQERNRLECIISELKSVGVIVNGK